VTLATLLFEQFFNGHVRTVPASVLAEFEVRSLTVVELLAFNDLKI